MWLNSSRPYIRKPMPLETALNTALTYGSTGWWTIEELEHFASPEYQKSRVFEDAMIELDFKRSEKYHRGWKKIKRRELVSLPPRLAIQPRIITSEEFQAQYQDLLVGGNCPVELGQSFRIRPTKQGILYIGIDVNPFAGHTTETLHLLTRQLQMHGHLAIQQKEFTIKGELIQIENKKPEEYVIITVTKENGKIIQIVWPARVENGQSVDRLLQNLLDKAGTP